MRFFLLCFFLFSACTNLTTKAPKEGKTVYSYTDVSGSYRLVREVKTIKQKLVTRNQIILPASGSQKVVEKSIIVSQKGTVKSGNRRLLTLRPVASEFTVWLEGKRYLSKMKLHPQTKSMRVTLDSPEAKWKGTQEIPFPKGRFFCFYSQMAECLHHSQLLSLAKNDEALPFDFFIIWDNYPYVQEQLTGVGTKLFSSAVIKFDGELKNRFRYIIETEGQMILYQFSDSFDLKKISWISQGLTVVPPGEEVVSEE